VRGTWLEGPKVRSSHRLTPETKLADLSLAHLFGANFLRVRCEIRLYVASPQMMNWVIISALTERSSLWTRQKNET
jgi:hypothetical protein